MALKKVGYVPTTVSARIGNTTLNNGEVYKNVNGTQAGYPSSIGSTGGSTGNGSFGSWYTSQGGTTKQNSTGVAGAKTGRSSGSGSASSASSSADAYNALLAAYRQNDYSDYLRQMREAAQSAYDRGMNALNSAYDSQLNSLSSNLNETRNQLANQYNRSKQGISDDAEASLRQAYINNMLNKKNLAQQMTAQGLTGGATETTMANMLNNYGNARNNINTTLNNNLANLEGNYSDNLSQAMQAYNSAVANANLQKAQQAMTLENALANNQISALGDYQSLMQRENQNYLDLLKSAIANGASFSWNPTEANNAVQAVALQQANNPQLVSNLTALEELMGQNTPGVTTPGVTVVNPATQNVNSLANILSQLRR